MSTSDTLAAAPAPGHPAPARLPPGRLFYWSVRRELWENRSVYVGPLAVAALILIGFLFGSAHTAHIHTAGPPGEAQLRVMREMPYDVAAVAILVISLIVGAFYCLGALHGERRDRSILFWKSLPVSDLTAVLAKASIPLIVLPAVAFGVILATQLVMFLINTVVLVAQGTDIGPLWAQDPVFYHFWVLPYGLVVLSLWYAPVYGWLLLVSAWARRTPILWAVGPVIGLIVLEKLALGASYVRDLVGRRLHGGLAEAFDPVGGAGDFSHPDPQRFLSTPDLWIGLAVAAGFVAGAVWLRRRGEPI